MSRFIRPDRCTVVAECRLMSRKATLFGGACIAYLLVLGYGTHTPLTELPIEVHHDKLCHFAAYFVLGAIVRLMLSLPKPASLKTCFFLWAAVAAVGLLDETTQPLVGRSLELKDIAADWLGAATAIVLIHIVCMSRRGPARRALPPRPAMLIVPRRRPAVWQSQASTSQYRSG
jgi:VanZ family protein